MFQEVRVSRFPTPLGEVIAVVDTQGRLVRLAFAEGGHAGLQVLAGLERARWEGGAVTHVADQIFDYFSMKRRDFDLPMAPHGTLFQQAVWAELRRIPFGTTMSYGALALRLGVPGGARAVGRANGQNPIALVVPCHRVIGSSGDLTGYAGGLALKRALLEFEGASFSVGTAKRVITL